MTIITTKIALDSSKRDFSATDSSYLVGGNIIPHQWYQKFINKRGTPDLPLISVLSEIIYWHRPKRVRDTKTGVITYVNKFLSDAWQTSYEHFERKLSFNREKVRKILVKLEQMGICVREFRNVKLRGQVYNNRLFIHLNTEFLNSCTIKQKNSILVNDVNGNPSLFAPTERGASPHLEGDHIIDIKNKNIIKNRSIKSSFFENKTFFKQEAPIEQPFITSISNKPKGLSDFYPLSQEDCNELQSKSGRNFNLRAMNEILSDMSKRLQNRYFKSKNAFISYMSKVFIGEMRDPTKINNETFKIKNNITIKEANFKAQEHFLAEIENNLKNTPEWHLKKKLVCVLNPAKSYEFLKAYQKITQEGSTFKIHLTKYVLLKEFEKAIILNQVKSIYDNFYQNKIFNELEIVMPKKSELALQKSHGTTKKEQALPTVLPDTIWGKVRKSLISLIHKNGEEVDRYWFSKLDAEINEDSKTIHLKTSSSFIKDWVVSNYLALIEEVTEQKNYKVVMM
jgi:hypothetical protein